MRNLWTRLLILLAGACALWAQQGTANQNVTLRRDASSTSPKVETLKLGARVTLVDAMATAGFFHVRTEDDQVGWVLAKYVTLSKVPPPAPSGGSTPSGAQCDATLWSHVYHSTRLIVKQPCTEVTGVIVDATNGKEPDGVRHEADGDTHGWLKVDPQFTDLLNAGNLSAEGGNLVFEIVCRFPVTQPDAVSACQGYTDQVKLPAVGSHVRIVGTYVQDSFHAQWMEIHPVTRITAVP